MAARSVASEQQQAQEGQAVAVSEQQVVDVEDLLSAAGEQHAAAVEDLVSASEHFVSLARMMLALAGAEDGGAVARPLLAQLVEQAIGLQALAAAVKDLTAGALRAHQGSEQGQGGPVPQLERDAASVDELVASISGLSDILSAILAEDQRDAEEARKSFASVLDGLVSVAAKLSRTGAMAEEQPSPAVHHSAAAPTAAAEEAGTSQGVPAQEPGWRSVDAAAISDRWRVERQWQQQDDAAEKVRSASGQNDKEEDGEDQEDEEGQEALAELTSPVVSPLLRRMSTTTDPDMPMLELVERRLEELEEVGELTALSWVALPPITTLVIERSRPSRDTLTEEQTAAEVALEGAERLLEELDASNLENMDGGLGLRYMWGLGGEDAFQRALEKLQDAVEHGCTDTVEAAVETLLLLFRIADACMLAGVTAALAQCEAFPARLAAQAARLMMLRPSWPGRSSAVIGLCHRIALAAPVPVITACIDLVPREPTKDTLGFSWLLEPLVNDLAPSYAVGGHVEVLEDFMSDSRARVLLKKGTVAEVRDIDQDGDLSIRFDDIDKRQWVFRHHTHYLLPCPPPGTVESPEAEAKRDALPSAVLLLCDDLRGPPLCASSARALLMRLSQHVGISALQRKPLNEHLLKKAEQIGVKETVKTLREYQSVAATE